MPARLEPGNFEINDVDIILNRDQYETRSNVQLDIYNEEETGAGDYSSLSVAVIDDHPAGENGLL